MAVREAVAPIKQLQLTNRFLAFSFAVSGGTTSGRKLNNRLSNEVIDLPEDDFRLEFEGGAALGTGDFAVAEVKPVKNCIRVLYRYRGGCEVSVDYELPEDAPFLRKRISVRRAEGDPARLMSVDLDRWTGVRRQWRSMTADRLPFGSHPIFCDSLWAGVEFPVAFNSYDERGFILRSRPGGKKIGPDWVALRSTVVGVAEPGDVKDAFLRYIDQVRLAPPRFVAAYNSWWSLPEGAIRSDEATALIRDLKAQFFDRHGTFFDFVTIDAGWSDPRSIWQIDRKNLPDGFMRLREIIESAGTKFGLWISPSDVYALNFDYEWGAKNGYTVVGQAVSLADPKYRGQTLEQLRRLIREEKIGEVKYDGFVAREEQPHHGLLAGDDSVEPLAEYSLELIRASREVNPDVVTEPTYMNSLANYISPWIIQHANSVWGNSGGDCPRGLGPAPDYREAHTTAREYYIFSSLNEVWLPQNAVQYFDIVHCDEGQGFVNHAAMAIGRGRFFLPTYLNPKFMKDEDWRVYAGLLRWTRRNESVLRNTKVLPSRVELGDPYAYGHWDGEHGIVAVRNPSNESREYKLNIRNSGAPATLAGAVCYTQFPYRRGIAQDVSVKSEIALRLAPWELLFLEIVSRGRLDEPVVMGGRWRTAPDGSILVAPDWGVDKIRVIGPGLEQERQVSALPSPELGGEVLSLAVRKLPKNEWLADPETKVPLETVSFDVECAVSMPVDISRGKVLMVLEFPGRTHKPSWCKGERDGVALELQRSTSAGHVGYWWVDSPDPWKSVIPFESEWEWYLCEAGSGKSRISFHGAAADPATRIGLWAWADFDRFVNPVAVPLASSTAKMPQYRDELERIGICLRPTSRILV